MFVINFIRLCKLLAFMFCIYFLLYSVFLFNFQEAENLHLQNLIRYVAQYLLYLVFTSYKKCHSDDKQLFL